MMLGAGESNDEIAQTIRDLAAVNCHILTLGQYLSPSSDHVPVERYLEPDEFAHWREHALALDFRHVESGPLVRSSYHADRQIGDMDLRATPEQTHRTFSPPPGLQQIDTTLS